MTTFAPQRDTADSDLRMSEILSAHSYALDITEGQPEGHAMRTCLLLKDLCCSSNAARLCCSGRTTAGSSATTS